MSAQGSMLRAARAPLWPALLLLALGGCAGFQPSWEPAGPSTQPAQAPAPEAPDAAGGAVAVEPDADASPAPASPVPAQPEPPPFAPAIALLQEQAAGARADGDYERAAALLERALRIEPQNAALWHELAVSRHYAGDHTQAEGFALRSNELARGDRRLQQRNWELIATTREYNGDFQGTAEALERAEALASP